MEFERPAAINPTVLRCGKPAIDTTSRCSGKDRCGKEMMRDRVVIGTMQEWFRSCVGIAVSPISRSKGMAVPGAVVRLALSIE
jgi:hypothetical protein